MTLKTTEIPWCGRVGTFSPAEAFCISQASAFLFVLHNVSPDIEVQWFTKNYEKKNNYTRKNYELLKVVENRIEQCCAAHIVQYCQQY